MSPHALFKGDKAGYIPNFRGTTISSPSKEFDTVVYAGSKKATLIALFSTQMAHRMCKPYLDAVKTAFPAHSDVGVVQVQFEENWMKWALIKYYIQSYIRQQYTPEQQVLPIKARFDVGNVRSDESVRKSTGGGGDTYYEYASWIYHVGGRQVSNTVDGNGNAMAGGTASSEKWSGKTNW